MRLIDADALPRHGQRGGLVHWKDIENAQTVDAVPVVRCKDCKHHDPEDMKCDCGHAIQWQVPRDDDWFCADGERKEAKHETD